MEVYQRNAMQFCQSAGYSNPKKTLGSSGICMSSIVLATILAKAIISEISIKSHLVFGTTGSLSAVLIFQNEKGHNWVEGLKEENKKWGKSLVFVTLVVVPVYSARKMTRWFAEKITWKNAMMRSFYHFTAGTTTSYFLAAYNKHDRRQ